MKKAVSFVVILLLLLAAAAGCGSPSPPPVSEESTTTSFEEPTSSYAELQSEIDRLEQLLVDNHISYWREPHPIDVACNEAIQQLPDSNPLHVGLVLSEYGEIWKEEMEKYLGLLAEVMTAEHKKMLDANQKNWEAFTDGKNKLEYEVIGRASGYGTMMRDIAVGHYYDKYRDRALFLEMLYNNAQDYSYEVGPWNGEE